MSSKASAAAARATAAAATAAAAASAASASASAASAASSRTKSASTPGTTTADIVFRAPAPPATLAPEPPPPAPFKGMVHVGRSAAAAPTEVATAGSWAVNEAANSGDFLRTLIVLDGVYLRRITFAVDFQSLIDQLHSRLNGTSYRRVLCAAQPIEDEAMVELCLHPPEGPGLDVEMGAWKRGVQPGDSLKPRDRAGVDAAIATTILYHAWTDQCDRIVVVSGDGYFVEALKICRDIVGKLVVVAGTYTSLSPVLQMAATDILYLDGILNPVGEFGQGVAMPRSLKNIRKHHTVQFGALESKSTGSGRGRGGEDDEDEDDEDLDDVALQLQSRAHAKARRERERERAFQQRQTPSTAAATAPATPGASVGGASAEPAPLARRRLSSPPSALAVDDTPDAEVPTGDVTPERPILTVVRTSSGSNPSSPRSIDGSAAAQLADALAASTGLGTARGGSAPSKLRLSATAAAAGPTTTTTTTTSGIDPDTLLKPRRKVSKAG